MGFLRVRNAHLLCWNLAGSFSSSFYRLMLMRASRSLTSGRNYFCMRLTEARNELSPN